MIGLVFTTLHASISPPTGVITLSISAAVVPGAKFCISTENGPASPRIEISGSLAAPFRCVCAAGAFLVWALGPVGGLNLGPVGATDVGSARSRALASFAARFAERGFEPGAVMREARLGAETEVCRSCVHSPLMLPGGGLLEVEATLY